MAKSGAKGVLLAVGVVAAASIVYLTVNGRVGPDEGAEGTIGAAEQHQMGKTTYYEEVNKREGELSTEKIEVLGTIAAKFEYAPAEAEKMLEEHGWSRGEFDKMVEAIRNNDELNKVFQASKKLASQR